MSSIWYKSLIQYCITVAVLLTEYDVARGILKFQCTIWEFRAASYSVNSQAIILLDLSLCQKY